MFGYVTANKLELKVKDYYTYRGFYCGLCRTLHKKYGIQGQLTLSYDMTFLIILLTSLYEKNVVTNSTRCAVYPMKKHLVITNEFTEYAADMNIVLAYYNMMDNWEDEKDVKSLLYSHSLKHHINKIMKKYSEKVDAIILNLCELSKCEKDNETNVDRVSYCFGKITEEIFAYKSDEWEEEMRRMGFFLGKFIYIMDAYEDLSKDNKKNMYNPLKHLSINDNYDKMCEEMLVMMMAECSGSFERMPILENADLLRNILYSGVWGKWNELHHISGNEHGFVQL